MKIEEGLPTAEEVWETLTYTQKLAAATIVFRQVWEHIKQPGTYRYLIYDRLGFDTDAYCALYPEGMNISNFIHDATSKQSVGK